MATPKMALIPSAQGTKLYSVLPANGVGDFSFTRGSSATRINSQGLIETVASGVSRLNYPLIDGVVNGCPSHLLEPQRLQLIQYSEDFSQGYWTKSGSSVVSGFTSPKGDLSSFKLVESGANSVHYIATVSSPVTGGAAYTYSFYAKPNGRTVVTHIDWSNNTADVSIDIQNETISGANTNIIGVSFTSVANGFKRVEISYNLDNQQAGVQNRIYLNNNGITYTGDGTSGIYIFGAQLEEGSFPTSYIPNYGTAAGVTRSAETANGSGDASTFNDSEGVLYYEGSVLDISTPNSWISVSEDANINNNQFNLRFVADSNLIQVVSRANGLGQDVVLQYTLSDKTIINKIAIKYKLNDWALWVNGIEVDTETSSVAFTSNSLDVLDFDRGNNSNNFYGNVKDVRVYNTALTDSELQALTQ